jgi:hypothetical protein
MFRRIGYIYKRNYWVAPIPVDQTKYLIKYPLVSSLESVHAILTKTINPSYASYNDLCVVQEELKKLSNSIEQIKKNQVNDCVKII